MKVRASVKKNASAVPFILTTDRLHAPNNLRNTPLPGFLVSVLEEQLIIAEIRQMRTAALSYDAIAGDLNERGIVGKRGGKFYACTVRGIVMNDLHA